MQSKDDQSSSGEKGASSKRKLLKSLVAGGTIAATLPAKWTTPLVESVMAPAHAGVSPDPPADCGTPSCADGSVSILMAVLANDDDLLVAGDYNVPSGCKESNSASLLCEAIDEGSVIGSAFRPTVGQSCASGCLVSCSVEIDSSSHSLGIGDCVTMRFTFDGNCTCSAVATIT